jgi:ABC-type phosphate transport system substrate-binding protein
MNYRKMIIPAVVLAGLCGLGVSTASAQVEQCGGSQPTSCVQLNGGGSSAATPFMTQVPLSILDQAPNLPIHYVNGVISSPSITSGKLHVWTGTRGGTLTIIRYSATGSSDGIKRLQQVTTNALSNMNYLDHIGAVGCGAPVLKTRSQDGRQYWEYTGCNVAVSLPMTMGMADVGGKSFHQSGGGAPVLPLDDSTLTVTQTAIVPWSFILGANVKKNVGGVLSNATNLSRTEIEAIFSRNVTDWRQVGLVTDVTTPGTPDATSPITLCLRAAGSGSKAAFDETVMKDATETPFGSTVLTNPASGVYFGQSTQDVQDCMQGNSGAGRPAHTTGIGYVDADVAVVATGSTPYYPIALNGLKANDTSLADPKINIRCGAYLYWAGERMNVRNYTDPGIDGGGTTGPMHDLNTAFITSSSSAASIALLPAGAFWVAGSDMYVSKVNDAGPILFTAGPHPCNTN